MRTSGKQCSFCLSKNPVHRLGSKCKPLMNLGMNVEINAQNFPLISTRPLADASNLAHFDATDREGISGKFFVHVKNKAIVSETATDTSACTQIEGLYICTVYIHATQCLGAFLVPSATIAVWSTGTICRVFISGSELISTQSSGSLDKFSSAAEKNSWPLANPPKFPEKRKHDSNTISSITHSHVDNLQKVWDKRAGGLEETWLDSRIGRITGTTAKIVMTGKNKPSGLQLSLIFGLSTLKATTKMEIGSILEPKILQAFCKQNKLNLKKERGGSSLTLLYQHAYVGHTPDGKTTKSKDDDGEVIEVKVVFNPQVTLLAVFKQYMDQLQLGLFVHRCKTGRLLVYRCDSEMTKDEAELQQIEVIKIEEHRFEQDKVWFSKFKPNVEAFYTDHLEWFYGRTFDVELARQKVEKILTAVKTKRNEAVLKKQKLLQT